MQRFSYVRTPAGLYWLVMAPICGLELFLLLTDSPGWMRWSAGFVVLLTIHEYLRGYARRLVLTEDAARFKAPFREIVISWKNVRAVGAYVPGGGLGATEYVYISSRLTGPEGKWDIGQDMIQLQSRPGLLETIHDLWVACRGRVSLQPSDQVDQPPP